MALYQDKQPYFIGYFMSLGVFKQDLTEQKNQIVL